MSMVPVLVCSCGDARVYIVPMLVCTCMCRDQKLTLGTFLRFSPSLPSSLISEVAGVS